MQKIAILGGGVGALTTAFGLTNDPGWKDKYEITFYQLGWRLGGKGASGRNRAMSDRIQEHGIHLWMGFYENAFHMIRKAYAEANEKNLMPTSPFKTARDAFSPMNYTPMMEKLKDGTWKTWNIDWTPIDPAVRNEFPGEDRLFEQQALPPTPGDFVAMILRDTTELLNEHKDQHPVLLELYREAMQHLADAVGGWKPELHEHHEPEGKHTLLERVAIFFGKAAAYVVVHSPEVHKLIAQALRKFNQWLFDLVRGELEKNDELRHVVIIVDTAIATIIGILEDEVLDKGFMAIEDKDFIAWLKEHGCNYADSPLTRGMYDACFAYLNGEPDKMTMAAGSTLYGALRLIFTYRGALMWWMNAGMGETIMSPLYLVLKNRGVKFKFFHKVTNLGLAQDKHSIDKIELEIQATPKGGEYDPLFIGVDGVPCWPTEPFWDKLEEGAEIQKYKNPDLESWWTDWRGKPATLAKGQDFDLVVLGVSLGPLPYISQELITASQAWRDMTSNVKVVRTQALQLWLNKTLPEVGWKTGRGILCGYTEPFDTWSDMAQILPRETWPPSANVQQIAYFCNVIPDDPLKPFDQTSYPAEELDRVKKYCREFLDGSLLGIWPATAVDPKHPVQFNDTFLVNCANDPKQPNFDTQFFRVNIDPSELYVMSVPKSTKYRLKSGESGFENLYLAGDWTLTDINIGCIEAAVISGCMASRAICGKPEHIYGAFGSVIPMGKGAGAQ
jgi:uncharacterized protein with NAD-binding domain and iron-sulfur cluster